MLGSLFDGMETTSKSVGLAILCSMLVQHLAASQSKASELGSEILAWASIPFLFKRARGLDIDSVTLPRSSRCDPGPTDASSSSLWLIAVCLASLGFCKADNGMLGLWPAITPFVLAAQRHSQTNPARLARAAHSHHGPYTNAIFTGIFAVLSNLALTRWQYFEFCVAAIPVMIILLIIYLIFMHTNSEEDSCVSKLDIEGAPWSLSLRVVIALIIAFATERVMIMAFGLSTSHLVPTLVLAVAKAMAWFFTLQATRHASWYMAMAIGTFAIMSTLDPSDQPSGGLALFNVVAACLVLTQILGIFPKQDRFKHVLFIFALFPLVPYVSNLLAIEVAQSAAVGFSQHYDHPVETLIRAARTEFGTLLRKQSKSFGAAREEYERRYKKEPPPGFEAWYDYAVLHQSPLIDDFDTIYDSISPFWRMNGSDFNNAMRSLQGDASLRMHLWLCRFSGQNGQTKCSNPYRTFDRHISLHFNKSLGELEGKISDIEFIVNHLDEPMVLIPPLSSNGSFSHMDMSRRPTWNSITKFCGHHQARADANVNAHSFAGGFFDGNFSTANFSLPFIGNLSSNIDLCQHPNYETMHGLFMSPTSFHLVEGLAPILSTGSPSTMGDILYPSAAYIEEEFRYDEDADVDWSRKYNKVYWAGSTTGGFASDDWWRCFQRQRFVSLAQNLEHRRQRFYYLRGEGRGENNIIKRVDSTFFNTRFFDVTMTRVFQCDKKYCRDQKHFFKAQSWADKNEAFKSRLVFDVDGNGISGRYYKLLASKSAPLKQTLFREWHDDRLIPWVHYVPVSQGMEELPELVTYLLSTEAGQQRAREIAEQGRDWFGKAFREVDMSIYMYRLLLELARLQDPKRQAE